MLLKKNESIVFAGDSITDCGRIRPEGEGAPVANPFGNGYVNLVFGYLHSKYPSLHIRVINQGISGNKSDDLLKRYDEILDLNSDWVFLMIGVNDVWRRFDCPEIKRLHVCPEQYQNNVEEMIQKTIVKQTKMVILSPFIIHQNEEDEMKKELKKYQGILKDLSKKYNLDFIDIQAEFDKILNYITTFELSKDRIHPSITGHFVIMQSIMSYLESN
ncbi:MAG: SGNH/GDSL hydrolase family protein [Bacilli bacterium]|nr:SGNH/GDSL hydrolase family protein [Bacilli bacterium]